MKTKTAFTLVLAVVLGTTALLAAPDSTTAYAFPVNQISHQNMKIGLGTSDMTVLQVLGIPARRLSPSVWVYYNFHAKQKLADHHGCTAMVVTFEKGKVVDLKFANFRAVNTIAKGLRSKSTDPTVEVAATR